MTLLETLRGADEGEAYVRLAHAEALKANGEDDAARDAIQAMRIWLLDRAARISDPGLARSFLERVPENARALALAGAWT
jgi:eukaryotic-like serine/threonine-protein kinase